MEREHVQFIHEYKTYNENPVRLINEAVVKFIKQSFPFYHKYQFNHLKISNAINFSYIDFVIT